MTQLTSRQVRICAGLAIAVMLVAYTSPTFAQPDPYQPALDRAPPRPAAATSDRKATEPTPAEQRETRTLAGAVFAKPAAAARAGDKAVAATQPDLTPHVQPKPEWTNKDGVQVTDKGLEFKSPF